VLGLGAYNVKRRETEAIQERSEDNSKEARKRKGKRKKTMVLFIESRGIQRSRIIMRKAVSDKNTTRRFRYLRKTNTDITSRN